MNTALTPGCAQWRTTAARMAAGGNTYTAGLRSPAATLAVRPCTLCARMSTAVSAPVQGLQDQGSLSWRQVPSRSEPTLNYFSRRKGMDDTSPSTSTATTRHHMRRSPASASAVDCGRARARAPPYPQNTVHT